MVVEELVDSSELLKKTGRRISDFVRDIVVGHRIGKSLHLPDPGKQLPVLVSQRLSDHGTLLQVSMITISCSSGRRNMTQIK
jgi:hypothetical protein